MAIRLDELQTIRAHWIHRLSLGNWLVTDQAMYLVDNVSTLEHLTSTVVPEVIWKMIRGGDFRPAQERRDLRLSASGEAEVECEVCDGAGETSVTVDECACEHCSGTHTCDECEGSGKVRRREAGLRVYETGDRKRHFFSDENMAPLGDRDIFVLPPIPNGRPICPAVARDEDGNVIAFVMGMVPPVDAAWLAK